jgi:hypothetical protein
VVFAGEAILRGNFRGVQALSQPMRPAKNVVFAGEAILRGNFRGVDAVSPRDPQASLSCSMSAYAE